MAETTCWAAQSAVTDPGQYASVWDAASDGLHSMHAAVHPLIFHYRGDGDYGENGIDEARVSEVDTRYADDMLALINAPAPIEAGKERPAADRMVGCCRDWAVLLVSLARHKGIPARMRVGFASYFADGWWIDHSVAEIWDVEKARWRLIDAEIGDGMG